MISPWQKENGEEKPAEKLGERVGDLLWETSVRRSVGALCACTSLTMADFLPKVIFREVLPMPRARIKLTVTSTYKETTLPPALNDVLVAHPSPAAMSRFQVSEFRSSGADLVVDSRSSGLWVSTAMGSTGAMAAAGGAPMSCEDQALQWRIQNEAKTPGRNQKRPPYTDALETNPGALRNAPAAHPAKDQQPRLSGFVPPGASLRVKWNSQEGATYVDGNFVLQELELGDELRFSADATPLLLF
mmetsp:Transcript_57660/g.130645  ORF Transcript_57660/g.130645 Transcript_57660/m.130645 type:complete len:245 (-) Transcript_57660:132-866(-)